ncbi:MAG TPA: TlpA disulfide reductase family protein [Terriglobales bacterium]|nr:TlpA disulfide reductase family protein [Terriglobales bacterium]
MRSSLLRIVIFAFLVGAVSLIAQTTPPPIGLWQGTIQSRAGIVTFQIEVTKQAGGTLQATLINATDRQPFSSAEWSNGTLTLRMNYYDGVLTLHSVAADSMEGEYSRQTSKGVVHIPVSLAPRHELAAGKPWTGPSLAGDWVFTWPSESGAEKTTRASFQQQKDTSGPDRVPVTGTIQPVSGDTGLLHGVVTATPDGKTHFHLSRFDGIHVMAIDGDFQPDGSLKGQQGGIKGLEDFTAVRATDAKTANPNALAETLTHVKDPSEPFRFSGVDASGKTVTQDSPEFKGKPLIVDIFGTWCPNCHDEAPVLEKLYQKYHNEGLEIVGVAYEYVDDTPRNLKQIAIYREKFGITFPLLLSGTTDEGQIARTLPQLVGFGAFPTSIFIDRNGHVRQILAGFTGPSTGEKYQEVQQRMDELVREIVAK